MSKQKSNKLSFKDEWYFLKQDIASYSISTIIYLSLCLIREFSFQSLIYGLFECILFYVSFWFIRINFDDTYHSDVWDDCKFWTRIMLNISVIVLWMLPIKYTLLKSILVAFICCLILYLVKVKSKPKLNIYSMNEKQLYEHCRSRGLSDVDCKIAYFIVYERLKGKELYKAINYSEIQSKRKRKEILEKIQ